MRPTSLGKTDAEPMPVDAQCHLRLSSWSSHVFDAFVLTQGCSLPSICIHVCDKGLAFTQCLRSIRKGSNTLANNMRVHGCYFSLNPWHKTDLEAINEAKVLIAVITIRCKYLWNKNKYSESLQVRWGKVVYYKHAHSQLKVISKAHQKITQAHIGSSIHLVTDWVVSAWYQLQ